MTFKLKIKLNFNTKINQAYQIANDEQLIKMATIIQRALNNSGDPDSLGITEAEKEELMAELEALNSNYTKEKNNGKDGDSISK